MLLLLLLLLFLLFWTTIIIVHDWKEEVFVSSYNDKILNFLSFFLHSILHSFWYHARVRVAYRHDVTVHEPGSSACRPSHSRIILYLELKNSKGNTKRLLHVTPNFRTRTHVVHVYISIEQKGVSVC